VRSLSHQRCFNHSLREAAARCPECTKFYCRECITEHDDRVICAACLKKVARVPFTRRTGFVGVVRAVQLSASLLILVVFFYLLGRSLLSVPVSFHDGTVWKPDLLAGE
jgi:hypothetical protein